MHPRLTRYQMVVAATIVAAAAILLLARGSTRWAALAALCAVSGTCVGLGVSFPGWRFFGDTFCRARTERKVVAMTFDDGPDAENTPALLDLLTERKVPATFFCTGQNATRLPDLVKRIAAKGHEVENHTSRHSPMTNLFTVARLREELTRAQEEIRQSAGRTPRFLRPPVGLANPRVFQVAGELGLTVTGYTARGLDRRNDLPEKIAGRLLNRLRPGAIFLLHDAGVPRERLLAVTARVLDQLNASGYRCVRLDELWNEHETNR